MLYKSKSQVQLSIEEYRQTMLWVDRGEQKQGPVHWEKTLQHLVPLWDRFLFWQYLKKFYVHTVDYSMNVEIIKTLFKSFFEVKIRLSKCLEGCTADPINAASYKSTVTL